MERRRKRRKSTGAAVYIPIAALLVIFLMIYGTSAFLKIIEIEVTGSSRYTSAEIIAAAGIEKGENMLLVDTVDAQLRVRTVLPYISNVEITRSMPDTIRIEVRESTAIASLAYRGVIVILDSTGKVLRIAETAQPDLIEIIGFQPEEASVGSVLKSGADDENKLKYLIEILSAIDASGIRAAVTYLDVTNILTNITLDYMEYKVLLGGPEDVRSKLDELPERIAEIVEITQGDKAGVFNMSRRQSRWEPER